jgi:rhomboid protease GluP
MLFVISFIMDADRIPRYSEELKLSFLKPGQYLAAAQRAAVALRWRIISIAGSTILCQTSSHPSFGERITISIENDKALFQSESANEYYWVDGQNEANATRFKRTLVRIAEANNKAARKLVHAKTEKYGALVPSGTFTVTPVIVYINVMLFIAMVFAGVSPITPLTQSLLSWGGNFLPAIAQGQWWRLVSYMFLHAGVMHLLGNMFALLYIGMFLEPLLGKFRFGAAYLLTGICAGLVSLTIHTYSVGVGASGAIFGMYGIFLSMLTTTHIEKTVRKTMLRSILFFVVFNLMTGLQGNTDNAAHIGGLVSGMLIGYIYYPGLVKQQDLKKQIGVTLLITAVIAMLGMMLV